MGNVAFFANSATLSIDGESVAVLKGFEITPKFEIVELYGMEKLTRQAVARHSQKCDVSCKYAAWATSSAFMTKWIAQATGNTKNTCGLFTVTAIIKDTTGAQTLTMTASSVYFDSVPYAFSENEFMVRDLKGTAKGYTISAA